MCIHNETKCHKTIPLLPEMHSHSTDVVGTYFLLGSVLGACVSLFPDKNPCRCVGAGEGAEKVVGNLKS